MSKLRVVAVGNFPMIAGFALAGVSVIEADTRAEAASRLADVLRREDVGVVIAQQATIDALPDSARVQIERRAIPVLLSLPAPAWTAAPGAASDMVLDLLQRAIGYRVRLQ
jgi:vacuolar-type H+-ATPase subunit F/Vma7